MRSPCEPPDEAKELAGELGINLSECPLRTICGRGTRKEDENSCALLVASREEQDGPTSVAVLSARLEIWMANAPA